MKLFTSVIKPLFLLFIFVVLLAVPLFTSNLYYLHVMISIFLNIILAVGLLLIFRSGQLSVGHIGFMCLGAYTSGTLAAKLGVNFWLAMPIAIATAGLAAILLGRLTLRLRGLYFILVSFSFAAIVALFFGNLFEDVFGGNWGLTNIPPPETIKLGSFINIDFSASRVPFYYLALIFMLVAVIFIYRINNSRVGRSFQAIAQAESLAEAAGLNILSLKVLAFVIGCVFAGAAGAFYAQYHHVIVAADFDFERWTNVLTYMAVGGLGGLAGPIVGASVLTVVYELLATLPYQRAILFGVLLIVIMVFQREGLIGLPGRIYGGVRYVIALTRSGKKESEPDSAPH